MPSPTRLHGGNPRHPKGEGRKIHSSKGFPSFPSKWEHEKRERKGEGVRRYIVGKPYTKAIYNIFEKKEREERGRILRDPP